MNEQEREAFEAACTVRGLPVRRLECGHYTDRDTRFFFNGWLAARKGMVPAADVRALCEAVKEVEVYESQNSAHGVNNWLAVAYKKADAILAQLNTEGGDEDGKG